MCSAGRCDAVAVEVAGEAKKVQAGAEGRTRELRGRGGQERYTTQ